MKRLLCVIALAFTASCASQNNMMLDQLTPIESNTSISSKSDQISYLDSNNSTRVNKDLAIKRLTNDVITVEKTSLLEPTDELYVIEFSKGRNTGTIGELVLYVKKSGESELSMRANYHNNIPTSLTFDETKKLLKSSSNYKKNLSKLGKLFGN